MNNLNKDTAASSLDGKGERIDLVYRKDINFNDLDLYQKSHYRRYEFATSLISHGAVCGDFACGTGYGSVMLSQQSQRVYGADINNDVVTAIKARYKDTGNVEFVCANILELSYESLFDNVISFETIEHLEEADIPRLLKVFHKALKSGGRLVFSTPFMQERSEVAIKMGFHHTFYIDEKKIEEWLAAAGFQVEFYKYQNYATHTVSENLSHKDFIICVARKDGTRLTPFKTRKSLEQENETLRQAVEANERNLANIQANIGKYLLLPKQGLTFAEDLLYTYHNADFTKDPLFVETYDLVKKIDNGFLLKDSYSIRWRIHVLCWAAYHAQRLEGDFVDCGVGSGLYARGVMHFIDFQKLDKKYFLLDTFAGLDPEYSSPREMQRNEKIGYGRDIGAYEKVVETFAGFNVEIVKGPVPKTLSRVNIGKVCYLSIDMNCVLPETAALEFFWEKMVSGGVIVIDDYGYPGHSEQKEAHDAFAKSKNVLILSLPTCQGLIVKP